MQILRKALDGFNRIIIGIALLCAALMMVQVTLDVLCKYLFNYPIPLTLEAVASFYMVALIFLYVLPQHDVVRITGPEVIRQDFSSFNRLFYAQADSGANELPTRDVRFIQLYLGLPLAMVILGTMTGKRLLTRLPREAFVRLFVTVLGILTVVLIGRWLVEVFSTHG